MAESQELNDKSGEQNFNPLLTFDPMTFALWVMIPQADVDRLRLTKEELVIRMVLKYGLDVNICIGQSIISNKDDS